MKITLICLALLAFGEAARQPLTPIPGQRRLDQAPRPLRRPPPRARPGLLSPISDVVNDLKCKAEEVGMAQRLQDKKYVRQQMDCVLDAGPCDKIGSNLKSE